MDIRPCNTDVEIAATYPVVRQLYQLPETDYITYIHEMMDIEYKLIALYEKDNCVGVVGYRVGRRLYCGKYLHVDNMIIDEQHRRQGHARQLVQWLKDEATRLECDTLLADTYVENYPAHSLFIKHGFHVRGYHLKMNVKNDYKTTFASDKKS